MVILDPIGMTFNAVGVWVSLVWSFDFYLNLAHHTVSRFSGVKKESRERPPFCFPRSSQKQQSQQFCDQSHHMRAKLLLLLSFLWKLSQSAYTYGVAVHISFFARNLREDWSLIRFYSYVNKCETDLYFLQNFQCMTMFISVFCKSCEMLCEPEIVQKFCS